MRMWSAASPAIEKDNAAQTNLKFRFAMCDSFVLGFVVVVVSVVVLGKQISNKA